ncbi:MAG: CDP-archaeol synthase, partial [Patescibacteria group bacterium]
IDPGKSLPIVDQVDSTIGALVVAWFFVPLTLAHIVTAIILFGPISFLVSYVGVKLKIKSSL